MLKDVSTDLYLYIELETRKTMMQIDVTNLIEKRQGLDYLPWCEAQILLAEHFPNLAVAYEMNPTSLPGDSYVKLSPWFDYGDKGYAVYPYLFDHQSGKRTPPMFYPVMDFKHKSHLNPTVCDFNNAMHRAAVKCIAIYTFLGIEVYRKTKEDVPSEVQEAKQETVQALRKTEVKEPTGESRSGSLFAKASPSVPTPTVTVSRSNLFNRIS